MHLLCVGEDWERSSLSANFYYANTYDVSGVCLRFIALVALMMVTLDFVHVLYSAARVALRTR